jgi:hypothetical protein
MNEVMLVMQRNIVTRNLVVDAAAYDYTDKGEGKQLVLRFANGFGLSIVTERAAGKSRRYADDANGLYEVGVCLFYGDDINDWALHDEAGYTDGAVIGWQSADDIENLLRHWAYE